MSTRESPSPTGYPVVLFDGVCNLCSSAVRWIIERDRRGRLRFASLQSDAARTLLASLNVPVISADSIVLVDDEGIHIRSEAAIRIARRLGFPWSLVAIGAILPRTLRDGIYSWIAQNRYRWFGRQQVCLTPTPELRTRFLDADEPVRIVGTTQMPAMVMPSTGGSTGSRFWPWVRLAHRFVILFLFLHVFPFPIGVIPKTEWPAEKYSNGQQVVVT